MTADETGKAHRTAWRENAPTLRVAGGLRTRWGSRQSLGDDSLRLLVVRCPRYVRTLRLYVAGEQCRGHVRLNRSGCQGAELLLACGESGRDTHQCRGRRVPGRPALDLRN